MRSPLARKRKNFLACCAFCSRVCVVSCLRAFGMSSLATLACIALRLPSAKRRKSWKNEKNVNATMRRSAIGRQSISSSIRLD
uniref:Putative secreted protein n=1 Tax=Anopheles marajoara TaxID=58244 RepID=A0A2M4CBT2_9DIPT